jgi:hypothetical protein
MYVVSTTSIMDVHDMCIDIPLVWCSHIWDLINHSQFLDHKNPLRTSYLHCKFAQSPILVSLSMNTGGDMHKLAITSTEMCMYLLVLTYYSNRELLVNL